MSVSSFTLFDFSGVSERQVKAVFIVRLFSATFSVIGSLLIVLLGRRKMKQHVYHRLMVMLSLTDLVSSTSFVLATFSMSADSGYPWQRIDSAALCTTAAFCYSTFYTATCFLCATLCASFVLVVRYNKSDGSDAMRYCERTGYGLALLLAPSTQIIALFDQALSANPFVHFCTYMTDPPGCSILGIECEKGAWAEDLALVVNILRGIPTSVAMLAVLLTYWTVRTTATRQLRYSFSVRTLASARQSHHSKNRSTNNHETMATSNAEPTSTAALPAVTDHQQKMRRLATRSALYILAYFNSIMWNGITKLVSSRADWIGNMGQPKFMTYQILSSLFLPLQGLFNFIIYILPILTEEKKNHPELYAFEIVFQLVVRGEVSGRVSKPATESSSSGAGNSATSRSNISSTIARNENSGLEENNQN